ncbi:LuxR family transcriptional regulator [Hankyongella ginsenosidimutans]|uniref:LuxR family transcriptional regulator n=1 Tax=Hankyongella ginsenosidimutans TaxID=1763828 RepID=A0A4D7C9H1_9SPHN|nr:LuxR family transcriptional regulator [Hankyongella ginsenosidimutans]QCI80488.1 LuxR family transcriptional regulator [Hankyongella ginsenosidimutans]
MRSTAQAFVARVTTVSNADDLDDALRAISAEMGFQHYALSHHVDIVKAGGKAIRLHDYPARWADYYDANILGVSDPVHRASHVTSVGFRWSHIPRMIALTARDRRTLALGGEQGIGDGYTIPANVPGEARGSCSFANQAGHSVPEAMLPLAQLAGAFAFEAARRLWSVRDFEPDPTPTLTDRQRDCALWAARGKSDWETSRILGLSEETVARHIRQGCERYGVNKRTLLAIRALFDGTLTFTDIFRR